MLFDADHQKLIAKTLHEIHVEETKLVAAWLVRLAYDTCVKIMRISCEGNKHTNNIGEQ